jgi:hypothetical protein
LISAAVAARFLLLDQFGEGPGWDIGGRERDAGFPLAPRANSG